MKIKEIIENIYWDEVICYIFGIVAIIYIITKFLLVPLLK